MALEKGDRVVVKQRGRTAYGFVRATGFIMEATLDDGSGIKAPATAFALSTKPLGEDSPFHGKPTEPGTEVNFEYRGQVLTGTIASANPIEAVIHADGFAYTVSQADVTAVDGVSERSPDQRGGSPGLVSSPSVAR